MTTSFVREMEGKCSVEDIPVQELLWDRSVRRWVCVLWYSEVA